MSFIDNIRMAQLYPAGANNTGSGVFGTPQINRGDNPFDPQPDPITEFAQRILPLIHGEQDRQRTFQQQDQQASNTNRLTDIANAAQHPDVVFRDNQTIRPLDAAKLAQNQQKIDETKSKDTGTLSLNKSKLNETKDHNDATEKLNQFKAMHPNMQILHPKGGNFQFLDPITHTMIDSGISTGTFTDEEMANTNQSNALDRIDETGRVNANNATNLEKMRQSGRVDLANTNNTARMKIEEYKQNNKDFIFKEIPGGNVMAFDPTNPFTSIDTGVSSGKLSDKDKIELGFSGQQDLENLRQTGRMNLKQTPAPLLPGQQNAQYNGRFNEVANTHPEWAKFVSQDPTTKTWSIKQPGTSGGPDDLTYHQIGDFIYGGPAATKDIELKPNKTNKLGGESKKADPLGIR